MSWNNLWKQSADLRNLAAQSELYACARTHTAGARERSMKQSRRITVFTRLKI